MPMSPLERHAHRNIALKDLLYYMKRFPAPAWVSLLHRVSGVLMFAMLPLIIWALDASLKSETSFERFKRSFDVGFGVMPGWVGKLTILAVAWAFLHHIIAGLRFIMLDSTHGAVERSRSARSAQWVLIASVFLTLILGAKIFSLY
jgi:succinate dehydrogenase / fumarate reductase, cytochrome b subunit